MGYNIGCFRELVSRGYDVHCVRWDKNKKTPYEPMNEKGISFYLRSEYTSIEIVELANIIQPKLILVSGWMDKDYLKVCKIYKNKIPVISGLDNWWKGTFKQYLASFLSPFLIKPYFNYLFVPGEYQFKFARKLGYSERQILTGLYTCNNKIFNNPFNDNIIANKKIIYVGRFVEIKGVLPFVKCFSEIVDQIPDWSLELYGNGELKSELLKFRSSQIKIYDFVEPEILANKFKEASVFCLPSLHEPWGLVVHEAACSRLPLLVSKNIGACTAFFDENGYSFDIENPEDVKSKILKICNESDDTLINYSNKSYELSKNISPQIWADQLLSTLN